MKILEMKPDVTFKSFKSRKLEARQNYDLFFFYFRNFFLSWKKIGYVRINYWNFLIKPQNRVNPSKKLEEIKGHWTFTL